jgi:uncharacterized protein (DUF488 family)
VIHRAIYSVGHARHDLETFHRLLNPFGIDTVVDVRSNPISRWAPDFRRSNLETELPNRGVRYLFMGSEVGGRPDNPDYYDNRGYVLFSRLARDETFKRGIASIVQEAKRHTVAIMCGEGKPHGCHRRLLIEPVLTTQGIVVKHIQPIGGLYSPEEIGAQLQWDELTEEDWKSDVPVPKKVGPKSPRS